MGGRTGVWLAAALLLIGGAFAIPIGPALGHASDSSRVAATGSITLVATKNYQFQPNTFQQVPTNATITVTFTEDDVLPHSFTISSREGFVIPNSYTPDQLAQLLLTYPPLYSVTPNAPGDQVVGTFQSPATPGWYEFVCNVTGHFQYGMYGFIAFGENLPSNLTSSGGSSGGWFTTLDAVILVVILIALVVGLVVWRRRRSTPPRVAEPVGPPPTATTEAVEVGTGREKGAG